MPEFDETLDPQNWDDTRKLAHIMVDNAIDHVAQVRQRPIWQEMPAEVRSFFQTNAPLAPQPLTDIYKDMQDNLFPYAMGNIHPRFWGWYMGSSNFTGALADFLAAIDGSNLGGGNTAPAMIDSQVVDWFRDLMGFPQGSSGTLTSGGSMANMVALTVARNVHAGVDVRADGIAAMPQPLRFYASDQVHSCHQKALEVMGHGAKSLCEIATDDHFRMHIPALEAAIARDRADGIKPACVIATAGSTNTGALDDLLAIRSLCDRDGMWMHIDGCIGALARLSPEHAHLVDGLSLADSVALDPHKWLHTPFEAGCVLIRDGQKHFETFEMHGDYLQMQTRGLISGKFLADYGFELSRGFKALKIWMSIKENGVGKFGRLIGQNIAQAQYMERQIAASNAVELMAPVDLNIVCFRYVGDNADEKRIKALNTEIMLQLQETGQAVVSDTTLNGRHCLRTAFNNHRTQRADIDLLLARLVDIGAELEAEGFAG